MNFVKCFTLGLAAFGFLLGSSLLAQDAMKSENQKLTFMVKSIYPVNVSHVYKMTEKTKVIRRFSDSTVKEYNRDMTVFLSLYAPSAPDNGFNTLIISVDSLIYKYSDEKNTAVFNSQDDNSRPPKVSDYDSKGLILGKSFELTYSPYGEIAKITGEDLKEKRSLVNDPATGIKDTIRRFNWNFGLSDGHLAFIGDLQKQVLPLKRIDTSDVWPAMFNYEIEGVHFSDTVNVKMKDYNTDVYNLVATMNKVKLPKGAYSFNGFDRFINLTDGTVSGTYTINVNPKGFIKYAEGNFESIMHLEYHGEMIEQKVTSTVSWELGKMYRL